MGTDFLYDRPVYIPAKGIFRTLDNPQLYVVEKSGYYIPELYHDVAKWKEYEEDIKIFIDKWYGQFDVPLMKLHK